MKVYFAADHAGFDLKNRLLQVVRGELRFEVEDCGAFEIDGSDDYPGIMAIAAKKLQLDEVRGVESRAILLGASGQGEAIAANRFAGVRAAVFYGAPATSQLDATGKTLDLLAATREHNDANALALGARYLSFEEAKAAVTIWLTAPFSREERHARRIAQLDELVGH